MGAVFLDFSTKQGQKKRLATKVRNLDSTNKKVRAMAQKEAIENTYAMRIDRASEQRNTRKAKRRK